VHPKTFAGAAAVHRRIHRPGAAPVDVLCIARPVKHAFGPGVALDHAFGIVGGMLRQRLDRDGLAGIDLDLRRHRPGKISPMHARGFHREVMMALLALGAAGRLVGRRGFGASFGARQRIMAAQLRQRLLRPAALAGHGRGRRALQFLLPEFARDSPKRWRNARLKCAESLKPLR